MQRELCSFPFPPQQRQRLSSAGFVTAQDILELKPSELSNELGISREEALEIVQLIRTETDKARLSSAGNSPSSSKDAGTRSFTDLGTPRSNRLAPPKSVADMLKDQHLQKCIITFSEKLDETLGGGIPLGKITEICGAPGIGKTQFSMQLSVDVQIPHCFGGVEGCAIYIDTEGSFIVDRVVDIATAAIKHCQFIASMANDQEQVERMKTFTLESILGGIHYFRCHDYVELLALIHTLPEFVQNTSKVSLIVLDSVAFPFRHDFEDYSLRTRLLNGLAQSFIRMATEFQLAVLLTNQMTTKISAHRGQPSYLIPALGESWGHASTIRLILYWQHNQRCALLYKSPSHKETTVPYQITTGGIRDIHPTESSTLNANGTSTQPETEENPPRKRPRNDA